MTSTMMLACSVCWNPIGAGALPVRLGDLAFHSVCVPRCRGCDVSLADAEEQRWTFDGQAHRSRDGYQLPPTEEWCDGCRELHDRDFTFARE